MFNDTYYDSGEDDSNDDSYLWGANPFQVPDNYGVVQQGQTLPDFTANPFGTLNTSLDPWNSESPNPNDPQNNGQIGTIPQTNDPSIVGALDSSGNPISSNSAGQNATAPDGSLITTDASGNPATMNGNGTLTVTNPPSVQQNTAGSGPTISGQFPVPIPIPGITWPVALGATALLNGGNIFGGGGSITNLPSAVGNVVSNPVGAVNNAATGIGQGAGIQSIVFPSGSGSGAPVGPNPISTGTTNTGTPNQGVETNPPVGIVPQNPGNPTGLTQAQQDAITTGSTGMDHDSGNTIGIVPVSNGNSVENIMGPQPAPGQGSSGTVVPSLGWPTSGSSTSAPTTGTPTGPTGEPGTATGVVPIGTGMDHDSGVNAGIVPTTPTIPTTTPTNTTPSTNPSEVKNPGPTVPVVPPTPTTTITTGTTTGTTPGEVKTTPVVPVTTPTTTTTGVTVPPIVPVPHTTMPDTTIASPLDRNYYNETNQTSNDLQSLLSGWLGNYANASGTAGQTDFTNFQNILNQYGQPNSTLTDLANQQTAASNTALRQSNLNDVGNLSQQALGIQQSVNPNLYGSLNTGQSAADQYLQQAQAQSQNANYLSPQEMNTAQQTARDAWSARGLVNSPGAVGDEILNTDAALRARQQQAFTNLGAAQTNYGQNTSLQSANQFNPFSTILGSQYGQQSQNVGTNNSLYNQNSAFSSGAQGNQYAQGIVNPNNPYSQDVYGSNFNAANARNIAAGNNAAAIQGANTQANSSLVNGFLNFAGQYLSGSCFVAREIYGENNVKWLFFRHWLYSKAPAWFRNLYIKHGEKFAKWIHDKPLLKSVIRRWMDGRIKSVRIFGDNLTNTAFDYVMQGDKL